MSTAATRHSPPCGRRRARSPAHRVRAAPPMRGAPGTGWLGTGRILPCAGVHEGPPVRSLCRPRPGARRRHATATARFRAGGRRPSVANCGGRCSTYASRHSSATRMTCAPPPNRRVRVRGRPRNAPSPRSLPAAAQQHREERRADAYCHGHTRDHIPDAREHPRGRPRGARVRIRIRVLVREMQARRRPRQNRAQSRSLRAPPRLSRCQWACLAEICRRDLPRSRRDLAEISAPLLSMMAT